ncbi:MAG: hypothetical protein JWL77_629, partial [Chthonomonadaceae bacterium]|nr:hypothetical protein [Chthonomonadaceae bacterium]
MPTLFDFYACVIAGIGELEAAARSAAAATTTAA